MTKVLFIVLGLCTLCILGCTMFQKNASSNEMEGLTETVLKKGQGIDIEIKPIPKEKCK